MEEFPEPPATPTHAPAVRAAVGCRQLAIGVGGLAAEGRATASALSYQLVGRQRMAGEVLRAVVLAVRPARRVAWEVALKREQQIRREAGGRSQTATQSDL